jgi:hypothetical protein
MPASLLRLNAGRTSNLHRLGDDEFASRKDAVDISEDGLIRRSVRSSSTCMFSLSWSLNKLTL